MRVSVSERTVDVAIMYAGSDCGRAAKAALQSAVRELLQLRALHAPFAVTRDEFGQAWTDTHNRTEEPHTLEALNAILANRQPDDPGHRVRSAVIADLSGLVERSEFIGPVDYVQADSIRNLIDHLESQS